MKIPKAILNDIIAASSKLDAENAKRFPPNKAIKLSDIVADDLGATPTELELIELMEPLSDEQKTELLALYWLGRGDFDDFDEAKSHALEQDPNNAHIYLSEKIGLGDMLGEGTRNL